MFKNKKVQMGLIVFVVVAILGGGFYFVFGQNAKKAAIETETQDVIQTLSPEELGLSVEMSPDEKKVKFIIENAKDITAIEYEITYEADATAEELREGGEPRVARGITGEAKLKSGKSSFESEWLDLGSCSRNVCKYDKGVSSIEITLKITKKDGKLYEATDTLEL